MIAQAETQETPIEHQLWCEGCGYRLDGLEGDGACPECGRERALSDPARRTGSPWQRRPSIVGWLASGFAVLRRPRAFWDKVSVDRVSGRNLALLNAGVTALIAVGIPAFVMRDPGFFIAFWLLASGTVLTLTLVEQWGIRFWGNVHGGRITKGVAWAVCGHASFGWVIGGVLVATGWIVGGLIADGRGASWGALGWRIAFAAPVSVGFVVGGGVVGLLLFETLTYLGARRMRFANAPRET